MTDDVKEEAPQQEPQRQIALEDIKTLGELRDLLNSTEQGLLEWAKRRIQETGYVQAVQTELSMHKSDAHGFVLRRLVDFAEKQEARIEALETLLAKAIGATKKGK